ncbi:hypothetical protein M422DRAFT_26924 [Sphaerobolus stellatus SS14]|nr:hypothetical protein M422DRAFT_26924 [Sphaerobolus stellatus SS14]
MSNAVLLASPDLSPPLAVEILPKGLTVNRFLVNVDGKTHDLIIGPNDPASYGVPPHKYQNTIIGRYSNRLPTGLLDIERNGIKATVNSIPNENEKVSLHGGPDGFDNRDWKTIDVSDVTLFSAKEKEAVAKLSSNAFFRLISEDGDQGFPGKLLTEVLFAVSPGTTQAAVTDEVHVGSLYVIYRAKLLSEGKREVTPINLTQHWGFNLDASLVKKGEPTPEIKDHNLFIKASNTIGLDDVALSTGKLIPVTGTPFDLRGVRLGDNWPARGHDQFHVFDPPATPVESIRLPLSTLDELDFFQETLRQPAKTDPLVKLSSERSGWTLAFDSNQPGVQFYSGIGLNGAGTRKPIHGWSGEENDGYVEQTFAFLEFHEPLAAWLHPETAVSGDTLVTSDELYNNFVRVDVLYKKPATAPAEE